VILASSLTKAAVFDAIHNRRVYATSSKRGQIIYTMAANGTTYHMGAGGVRSTGPVATTGGITLHVSGFDPAGASVTSIKIKEPLANNTDGSATVIASSVTTPFDYTFTPPAGKHTYYAYLKLSTGDEMWSAPIWINEGSGAPDTAPPTTSITSPTSGATVSGTTTVVATASDNVGVTRVEFFLDGVLKATGTTAPYSWSWNTTTTPNGSHTLTSKAYDAASNVGTSTGISVNVSNTGDTTPPTTSITSPANGATVSGTITVRASASDNIGVTKVEFYLDGVLKSTDTTTPYTWRWSTSSTTSGAHSLTSKAYDAAGNVGASSAVSVTK
jgi:hypothetical protein